jgi:hypothetical protein
LSEDVTGVFVKRVKLATPDLEFDVPTTRSMRVAELNLKTAENCTKEKVRIGRRKKTFRGGMLIHCESNKGTSMPSPIS